MEIPADGEVCTEVERIVAIVKAKRVKNRSSTACAIEVVLHAL